MNYGANIYQKNARATQSPRELESDLLIKAAAQLERAKDNPGEKNVDYDNALNYNRKLWAILAGSAVEEDNPLPQEIKDNIASLAAYIFQRTIKALASPSPQQIDILIRINREIASGLRGNVQ